jgi:hypothetical protein
VRPFFLHAVPGQVIDLNGDTTGVLVEITATAIIRE